MMDNKLSKPVGYVGARDLKELAYGDCGWIKPNDAFGESPVYSQEYVSALLAELDAKDKRIAELEAQLATPVRLPEKYNMKMAGDKSTKSMFYGHNSAINDSAKAIRAAGFTVEGDA